MDMKLVVIVLNKIECLEDLLKEFADRGLPGATILQSHGMMQELGVDSQMHFMLSLRNILNPEHRENRTIFMAAPASSVPDIVDAVNKVTGALHRSDTGILFTVPIDFMTGIEVNGS